MIFVHKFKEPEAKVIIVNNSLTRSPSSCHKATRCSVSLKMLLYSLKIIWIYTVKFLSGCFSAFGKCMKIYQPWGSLPFPSLLLSPSLSPSLSFPSLPLSPWSRGCSKVGINPLWGGCGKLPGSSCIVSKILRRSRVPFKWHHFR